MNNVENRTPIHRPCERKIFSPEITGIEEVNNLRHVCVQWFGESDNLQKEYQFKFPLFVNPDSPQLWRHPEWFRVVFIDQIKNWINPEAIDLMAEKIGDGKKDAWIIYAVTSNIVLKYEKGVGPATLVSQIVLLGDPNVGVIYPKRYLNMSVSEEEIRKSQKK